MQAVMNLINEEIHKLSSYFIIPMIIDAKPQNMILKMLPNFNTSYGSTKIDFILEKIDKHYPLMVNVDASLYDRELILNDFNTIGKYCYDDTILLINNFKILNYDTIQPYLKLIYNGYGYYYVASTLIIHPNKPLYKNKLKSSIFVDSTKEIINTKKISQELNFCFHVSIPAFSKLSDNLTNNLISRLRLYEDGIELKKSHSQHSDIRNIGKGLFSHWSTDIYFSSSDNSDPTQNGRKYEFDFRIKKVFVIGTCRQHHALSIGNHIKAYVDENVIVYAYKLSFPHYTKEIIQLIDILHGKIDVPTELEYPMGIFTQYYPTYRKLNIGSKLLDSDIILIELSSMHIVPKEFNGKTYYLNLVTANYKNEYPRWPTMPLNEIKQDIGVLQDILKDKKILFVTHHKNVAEKRNQLIDLIDDECTKLGIDIFKPHDYTGGDRKYLADDSHYSEEGLALMRKHLVEKFNSM